jgi:hypothetical protein
MAHKIWKPNIVLVYNFEYYRWAQSISLQNPLKTLSFGRGCSWWKLVEFPPQPAHGLGFALQNTGSAGFSLVHPSYSTRPWTEFCSAEDRLNMFGLGPLSLFSQPLDQNLFCRITAQSVSPPVHSTSQPASCLVSVLLKIGLAGIWAETSNGQPPFEGSFIYPLPPLSYLI